MASDPERGSYVHKTTSAVGGQPFSLVCFCPQWRVLNRAEAHIQELEQTLDNLLKLKGKGEGWLVGFSTENREIGLSQLKIYVLRAYCVPAPGPGEQ